MSMRYKFFQHTADAKFRAFGKSLEEAFFHAALAVASLMWDWEKIAPRIDIPITAKGKDLEQLLVNFLEEILYLLDTRHFLLASVDAISIEQKNGAWMLRAVFKGDERMSGYEVYGDVKAITYNEIDVSDRSPYAVQVVVDV